MVIQDLKYATLGCSHSGDLVGDSWPVVLRDRIGGNLLQYWTNGSGNEGINLEKLLDMCARRPDFVIVSLSDPARLTLGLDAGNFQSPDRYFNNAGYYTFNNVDNVGNLTRMGVEWTRDADRGMINFIASIYNTTVKPLHTLAVMEFISKQFDVPIFYMNWFDVSFRDFVNQSPLWETLIPWDRIIVEGIERILQTSMVDQRTDCYHWKRPAHEYIVDRYVVPFLQSRGKPLSWTE